MKNRPHESHSARSDKGMKRPWKRAPGADEGGDEDRASPAKKQRKSKAIPKPCASGKKAAKKSKKQQLPPVRPISNESPLTLTMMRRIDSPSVFMHPTLCTISFLAVLTQ